MRKIKVFMASVLTYFMAMSILPTSLLQTVANAVENDYSVLVKSDYYLKGNAQYSNESLIVYGKDRDRDTRISLVKNGQEIPLKEVKEYDTVQIFSKGDYKIILYYINWEETESSRYFEEFNFKTREFRKITEEEFMEFFNNGDLDGEVENKIWTDAEIEEILQKISKNYDVNLTISDKTLEPVNEYYSEYVNENERLSIDLQYSYNSRDIIEFYLSYSDKELNKSVSHYGIIYGDYVYIGRANLFRNPSYRLDGENIFIFEDAEDNISGEITKANKQEEISRKKIDATNYNSYFEVNEDSVYLTYYGRVGHRPQMSIYKENENTYDYVDNIMHLGGMNILSEDGKLMVSLEDNKISLIKIKGSVIEELYDFSNIIDTSNIGVVSIGNGREDNFVIALDDRTFIVAQKYNSDNSEKPSTPEAPTTPTNPEDNASEKPSEEKVVEEVSTIIPNEKNDIAVKTEAGTKNIEVIIKDIESIKNGTGSLNISMDNGVVMNLPLSLIDKSLLDGAKSVTIKLDILENSDIIKNIKAVNKVFDFNLIINKEDGTTNVHNFKDGLAEVKLTLTDKDFEGLNKDKIVVYYYNDSTKKFEAMETVVNGNEVTFKTSHFSKYVIAEKIVTETEEPSSNEGTNGSNNPTENKTEEGKGQLPETGAKVSSNTILVLALGMLVIGGTMFFRKRKHA